MEPLHKHQHIVVICWFRNSALTRLQPNYSICLVLRLSRLWESAAMQAHASWVCFAVWGPCLKHTLEGATPCWFHQALLTASREFFSSFPEIIMGNASLEPPDIFSQGFRGQASPLLFDLRSLSLKSLGVTLPLHLEAFHWFLKHL